MTFALGTAKEAFDLILQIGAGTGLLYLVRWFWWRVNAWCEIAAMISSFAVSIVLFVLGRNGVAISTHLALLITIAVTTICWVLTAFLAPPTDRRTLVEFYRKVKPFGPGWKSIRDEARLNEAEAAATHESIPLALLGWVSGCVLVWSALFAVGNYLYGRMPYALALTVAVVVSGLVLSAVIRRLWAGKKES
jgi:hypothetical protein